MQQNSKTVRTVIHVSPEIHDSANHLAEELGLSLSDLYSFALTSLMAKHRENITETLDRVYERESSSVEGIIANAQAASLGDESW